MTRFYPSRDFLRARAEQHAATLAGKPLSYSTPQDRRNAAARREIERRRMEQEDRQ